MQRCHKNVDEDKMNKILCALLGIVLVSTEAMDNIDKKFPVLKERLQSIQTRYGVRCKEAIDSIEYKADEQSWNKGMEIAKRYGAPWLDVSSKIEDKRNLLFPQVHTYNGWVLHEYIKQLDFQDFLGYLFPNAGMIGAYDLLAGKWGNTQGGGKAIFGDVGGYVPVHPGGWQFFFSVEGIGEKKDRQCKLLFRPQYGFSNLWDAAPKTRYTNIEFAPQCYMRIYYRQPDGSLNFTGASYNTPVSLHNAPDSLTTCCISPESHALPDVVQQSDSFVIVHRTIYKFGGSDPENNKVIYGVYVAYSYKDLLTFQDLRRQKNSMLDVLKEAPIIKDSEHLQKVLGVIS
jgi:hypothetical protein